MEVTRTLHDQVLQGILPIKEDNKLNEKVPLASYHTEVTAELRNWRVLRVSFGKCIYTTVLILSNRMRLLDLLHPLSLLRMSRTRPSEKLSRKYVQKPERGIKRMRTSLVGVVSPLRAHDFIT